MEWIFENLSFTENDVEEGWIGFIYLIENLANNKKYIGKKGFYKSKAFQVKNKKKKKMVQSDWQKYYGSSAELKEDIKIHGKENFRRTIIRICTSKSEMNYYELREQMVRDVLLYPDEYYNAYVGTRINRNQLKRLWRYNGKD